MQVQSPARPDGSNAAIKEMLRGAKDITGSDQPEGPFHKITLVPIGFKSHISTCKLIRY